MADTYRTALITGASSGLGRALSTWFSKRGVRVFAAARRQEQLVSLRDEARAEGGTIEPVEMDVSDTQATLARIRKLDAECGGLDLVVANAGYGEENSGKRLKWEIVERTIQVNVMGASATLCAVLPQMVERGRGHIVGISSVAAYRGVPKLAVYAGSKAYLRVFLEGLRVDLQSTGVKVTSIHPGYVKTEMTANNKGPMPFLIEAPEAADLMGKAILRGESEFIFPWQAASMVKALQLVPNGLFDRMWRRGPRKRA